MNDFENDEDRTARLIFQRMQGEDRADAGESQERVSSISPEEYRRRETEYKQKILDDEAEMQALYRLTRASLFTMMQGIGCLFISYIGIFWLWPYLCTGIASSFIQIAIVLPFLVIGLAGLIVSCIGTVRLLSARKKVGNK